MIIHPPELYKYKPIVCETDLERVLQIIDNHEIYIPSYHQLNDPLESAGAYISLAVPGAGNRAAMGEIGAVVDGYLSNYRILSFSSVPNSISSRKTPVSPLNSSSHSLFSDVFVAGIGESKPCQLFSFAASYFTHVMPAI